MPRRASTPALRDVGAVSAALQLSPLPTFMIDADGVVLACNDLFADEAGVPQALVLGRPWWEAFARASEDDARAGQRAITESSQARGATRFTLSQGDGQPAALAAAWHRVTEPGTHRLMWIFSVTSWQRGARDADVGSTPHGPAAIDVARVAAEELSDALVPSLEPADALRRVRATVVGLRRFARGAPGPVGRVLLGDAVRAAIPRCPLGGRAARVTDESRSELTLNAADLGTAVAALLSSAAVHARPEAEIIVRTYDEPGVACVEVRAAPAGLSAHEVAAGAGAYFATPRGAWFDFAVARAAMRALGATVRAASDPGGALVLAAAIPTSPAGGRAPSKTGERPAALASRSVLLVDDEPVLVRALGRLLESAGARVRTVGTAGEAVAAAGEEFFDAVVVDVHLPDGDGLGVARACVDRDPRTRVVMVTGQSDASLEKLATAMGARAVLEKPFEPAKLVSLLRDLLAGDA